MVFGSHILEGSHPREIQMVILDRFQWLSFVNGVLVAQAREQYRRFINMQGLIAAEKVTVAYTQVCPQWV